VYSPELTEALSRYDITGLADLEEKLISSFANSNRCWREGTFTWINAFCRNHEN
jgi:hypothetical protein